MFDIIKTHHIFSFEEIWYFILKFCLRSTCDFRGSTFSETATLLISSHADAVTSAIRVSNKTTLHKVLLISPASRKVATRPWRGLCVFFSRWPPIKRFSWNWFKKKKKNPLWISFPLFMPDFPSLMREMENPWKFCQHWGRFRTRQGAAVAPSAGCVGEENADKSGAGRQDFFFFFFHSTSLDGAVLTPLKRIQPERSLCFLCLHFLRDSQAE